MLRREFGTLEQEILKSDFTTKCTTESDFWETFTSHVAKLGELELEILKSDFTIRCTV